MITRRPTRVIFIHCFCLLMTALALLGWSTVSISAQNSSPSPEAIIPLEGLDPVALTQGKEVQGDMKYKVTRGRFEYIFTNAENKATFEKDPARYEIQLDGACARMGAPTSGDPDLYAVYNGRIYIFGSAECQTLFKATPEKYLEVTAPPKSPPTTEMIKRGQELIAKAVEALGGSKLEQLSTFQKTDLRDNNVKNRLQLAFPDALRQETVRPSFTLVSIVTPTESFFVVNNVARSMEEAQRASIHKELNHELVVLLRSRGRSDFKAAVAGTDKIGETAVERVDVELGNFTTSLAIDPATGRVLSQKYHGRGPGGVVGDIEINYSDFRAVEGLSLPFKLNATFEGQPFSALSATTEAITVNGQIDPSSFKKPNPAKN